MTGLRAHVGDARAHHAGAEHADLGGGELRYAGRPQRPGVDRLQVEEERLDHVLGVLPGHQRGEVARLDGARVVEVDLGALDGSSHDRLGSREVRALQLLAQRGREGGQHLRERRVRRGAAGHLVAVPVPGLGLGRVVVLVVQDPLAGRREKVLGSDDLVHQALGPGGLRLVALALEQHVHQRRLYAEQPHRAGHAAAAGKQTEGDLGQADLVATGRCDPVVEGQRDLQTAAESGAVDRRHRRDTEPLDAAQLGLDRPGSSRRSPAPGPHGPTGGPRGCRRRRRSSSPT